MISFSLILFAVGIFSHIAQANPALPFNINRQRVKGNRMLPKTCPPGGTLTPGSYISTSLIVPVSKKQPDRAFGSTDSPSITPGDTCAIFNLELDGRAFNKTCNLIFDFPNYGQASNPFFFSGKGTFQFTGYAINSGATEETTYNKQPPAGPSPPNPPPTMVPGKSYTINSAPCGIPPNISVTVSGMLCSPDSRLWFTQSEDTCPFGFFVVLT